MTSVEAWKQYEVVIDPQSLNIDREETTMSATPDLSDIMIQTMVIPLRKDSQ